MTGPVVGGAERFRRPGALERLAARIARFPIAPAARRRLRRLYHAALTIQSRGKGLSRSLPGGEIIRVLPQYAFLTWNVDEYRAFREVIRRGAVALDVGANVGAYSMLLGQWVGTSGAVFAFEPSPQMFDALVRHTELNGLVGVVRPVCAAVGGSAIATARFVLSDSPGAGHLASGPDRTERTISVDSARS